MNRTWILLSATLLIVTGCTSVPEVEDIQPEETEVGQVSPPEENVKATSTPSEPEAEHPTPVFKATSTPVKDPENPSPVLDEPLKSLIGQAKEVLSERLGVDVSAINLVSAEAVSWPDGSLGCPEPGMAYAQVITPGYLIVLEANNVEFEYHASRDSVVVRCKDPQPPVPGIPMDQ